MTNILELIPVGHENAIRRSKLCELTGKDDRMQDGRGYFRPKLPEEIDLVAEAADAARGRLYAAQVAIESLNQMLELYP